MSMKGIDVSGWQKGIDLSKIDSNASGEYETVVAIEDIYGRKSNAGNRLYKRGL